MRRNPLYRALRVDKMTLAALDATLVEHQAGRATASVPVLRMLHAGREAIAARAVAFVGALAREAPGLRPCVLETESAVGGGAAPTAGIPTVAVALETGPDGAQRLAARLRSGSPPVVARLSEGRLLLDLRTVAEQDEGPLLEALAQAARS